MIISINGKIGSGKDTVGRIIQYLTTYPKQECSYNSFVIDQGVDTNVEEHYEWQIKKFAGKLKEIASLMLNIPVSDFEKQEVKDLILNEEWWYYTPWNAGYIGPEERFSTFNEAFNQLKGGKGEITTHKPTVRWFL